MDDPSTLRKKAVRYFECAASSPTAREAETLYEVGRQLQVWADELEEMPMRWGSIIKPRDEAGAL